MLDKIKFRLVYNRKNHLNKEGKALVQIEAMRDGRKAYFSTKIYIFPNEWDKKKRMVVVHELADEYNTYLYKSMRDIEALELDCWRRGTDLSLADLKEKVRHKVKPALHFTQFCKAIIEDSDRRDSTKKNLLSTVKMLEEYSSGIGSIVSYDDINASFVRHFSKWLQSRGQKVNTVGKHLKGLRNLVNEAIRHGYMKHNPVSDYKIKTEKKEHDYLRETEVKRIERISVGLTGKEKHVADAFLFCCYTGLRYSDFSAMSADRIETDRAGHRWLKISTIKTGVSQKLPLHMLGGAEQIIDKYESVDDLSSIPCNSATNVLLKSIAHKAKINRRVTFHLARHTFATSLLNKGLPITTIQHLLGHTELRTTTLYAEKTCESIVKDLRRLGRQ